MICYICSGSGGIGKSSFAAALAVAAAKDGNSVILLDASGSAHSCDVYLGIPGKAVLDLEDVNGGEAPLSSAVYETEYSNLSYVMASHEGFPFLSEYTDSLLALQSMCKLLVVDMENGDPGIDPEIICGDDRFTVLLHPDPVSFRTAEQLLSRINRYKSAVSLVLNRVPENDRHALKAASESAEMNLGYSPDCIIPEKEEKVLAARIEETRINPAVVRAAEELEKKWYQAK